MVTHGKHRYVLDQFVDALNKQTVRSDVLFVVNNGEFGYLKLLQSMKLNVVEDPLPAKSRIEKIVNGRKFLRQYALDKGYDALLFVDSDVLLPENAVELLTQTQGDVVAGVYLEAFNLGGKTVVAPRVFKDLGGGNCQLYTYEGVASSQVLEVGAAGFGCCLISRKVLEKIGIGTFSSESTGGEDVKFFLDARKQGFKCVANTLVKCTHCPFPLDDPKADLFRWKTRVEDWKYELEY